MMLVPIAFKYGWSAKRGQVFVFVGHYYVPEQRTAAVETRFVLSIQIRFRYNIQTFEK